MTENTSETRQELASHLADGMDPLDMINFVAEELADRIQYWDQEDFDEVWEAYQKEKEE